VFVVARWLSYYEHSFHKTDLLREDCMGITSVGPQDEQPRLRQNAAVVLVSVALVGIAVHGFYMARLHDFLVRDSYTYVAPAQNMLAGRGFSDVLGHPETDRTPGYPLLVAAFLGAGLGLKTLVVFQHLLNIGIAMMVAVWTLRSTGSRGQALVAGILLATDMPTVEAANYVLTEALFTLVLLVFLAALWRLSQSRDPIELEMLGVGLLGGLTVMVRPITVFFVVAGALYLVMVRRTVRVRTALVFTLSFLVLPLGWAFRNYLHAGLFSVSSISNYNLLYYRAAGVLAREQPGDVTQNLFQEQDKLRSQVCSELAASDPESCAKIPAATKAPYESRLAKQILVAHRKGLVLQTARGAVMLMVSREPELLVSLFNVNFQAARWGMALFTLACLICGFAGVFY
jgi:hypothetical protein